MVEITTYEAIGQSEAFIAFQERISRVAPVERPVMVIGERGTGKEQAATRIHYLSKRWEKPLVTLNCAALTPTLIGSELFGYEKGAFTGAGTRTAGRFEQAAGGTLFLDEIGTIPMEVQEKILRVVEYGTFERVGSSRQVEVDVRIVAATNADLPAMAKKGSFKQDLLDRLCFEVIHVPPLRCRKEDILVLARHFAGRMAFELGQEPMPELTAAAENALKSYPWPGNVRELKNVVERAVYHSDTHKIDEICFDPFDNPFEQEGQDEKNRAPARSLPETDPVPKILDDLPVADLLALPLKQAVLALETLRVRDALRQNRFNQKKAAAHLGLTYDQFRGIKKRLGI
jgi:psp operon transcriptional activator